MENKNKKWLHQERKYLIDNYGIKSTLEMSIKLKRTQHSVSQQVSRLRKQGKIKSKKNHYQTWTEKEEETLMELKDKLRLPEIAKILGRKPGSIYTKLARIEEQKRIAGKKAFETKTEKDIFEEKAYQKLINEPVIGGVKKSDIKIKMGQAYKITRNTGRILKEEWEEFYGKVIHETKDHFTLKNKVRAETFLRVDFLIGEYKLKEIS